MQKASSVGKELARVVSVYKPMSYFEQTYNTESPINVLQSDNSGKKEIKFGDDTCCALLSDRIQTKIYKCIWLNDRELTVVQ